MSPPEACLQVSILDSKSSWSLGNVIAILACQSIGAAGLATSTTAGMAAGSTAVGGIVGSLWPWGRKKSDPSSQNQEANAKEETTKKEVSTTNDVQEESLTESENEEQVEETMEKDENVIEVVADEQDEAENLPSTSPKDGKLTSAKASKLDPKYTLVSLDNAVINISPSINLPKLM